MNISAYSAVVGLESGAGYRQLPIAFASVRGRDRVSFLQGQISNDIAKAETGQWLDACLLNSTGHMLAYLTLCVLEDSILVGTDKDRLPMVIKTLERYLVREKVVIEASPEVLITVQGDRAAAVAWNTVNDFHTVIAAPLLRFGSKSGIDLLVDEHEVELVQENFGQTGALFIDDETAHVLRVESGETKWGNELDETVIPLEAGLDKAISYTKGCYVGQEIIARIHSRGHTNRSLIGLTFEGPAAAGDTITATGGDKAGTDVGKITSTALSPRYGSIGLGYVRNDYAAVGTDLRVADGTARVVGLPFDVFNG